MNATLLKASVALVPVGMLFLCSTILVSRRKGPDSVLQLVGASSLVVVVLSHIFEALHLLPWMHWGAEHSAGHYVDLGSAVLGGILFPIGYLASSLVGDKTADKSLRSLQWPH